MHEGTKRHSGRYPWGSGANPQQRNRDFLGFVANLEKQGLSEKEIAEGYGITVAHLRARKTIATTERRQENIATANRLAEKGMSNVAIAAQMGVGESQIRAWRNPLLKERADVLRTTADFLKEQVAEKKYIDVGAGVANTRGISDTKLKAAIAVLEDEGYNIRYIKVPQGGNNETLMRVLVAPGVTAKDVYDNRHDIKTVSAATEGIGTPLRLIETPKSIDPSRLQVLYGPEGGSLKDGVIELRRGVDDISLGSKGYAQVRIAVGPDKYLKGMAMYADDLPPGIDMRFNTNKDKTANKLDALKPMKMDPADPTRPDPDFPFGSMIRQKHYTDKDGKEQL